MFLALDSKEDMFCIKTLCLNAYCVFLFLSAYIIR